jgi:ABC-type Zn uptake system ZnuABC Zn-binding protein ZnuA
VRPVRAAGAVVCIAVALAGCSSGGGHAAIVATTTQVADLARHVAGRRLEVREILRPGSDPHEYEPRPSDALAISHARLVLRSGGDVDGWLAGLVRQAGGHARVVTLLDDVRREDGDPHWWQDPRNAERAVVAIGDALIRADPAGARDYRRNAAAYLERLRRLDAGIARCVARIPPAARTLVTSHDSLGYYAHRYGFRVVGAAIPSLSSQAEPSAAATQRLVDQIRRAHVPAVFPESALNPKLERAIAREAHARVGGALWADSLGPPGSSGTTYTAALASNTATIVSALTAGRVRCRPPA